RQIRGEGACYFGRTGVRPSPPERQPLQEKSTCRSPRVCERDGVPPKNIPSPLAGRGRGGDKHCTAQRSHIADMGGVSMISWSIIDCSLGFDDADYPTDQAAASGSRHSVVNGTAVVYVGLEGDGARGRGTGGRGVLWHGGDAGVPGAVGAVVRARGLS